MRSTLGRVESARGAAPGERRYGAGGTAVMFERIPAPRPANAPVPLVVASMAEGNAVNYWLHELAGRGKNPYRTEDIRRHVRRALARRRQTASEERLMEP